MQATGCILHGLEAKFGVAGRPGPVCKRSICCYSKSKSKCHTHAGVSCQHLRRSSLRTSAPAVAPAPCHIRRGSKRAKMAPQAGIKAIESFDATFELNEEQDAALRRLLATEPFCQQVVRETQQPEGTQLEFTGMCWDVLTAPAGGAQLFCTCWSVQKLATCICCFSCFTIKTTGFSLCA